MNIHSLHKTTINDPLPLTEQLAWKLAGLSDHSADSNEAVMEMAINRIIDSVAVALAAINQPSVANARAQALAHPSAVHPRSYGGRLFGLSGNRRVSVEWAAYANTVAVNALGCNDVFVGNDVTHPSNAIPAILAVAQHSGCSGHDLLRGIIAAYEANIALARAFNLSDSGIHPAVHLAPAIVVGVGACLVLEREVVCQAIQEVLHTPWLNRHASNTELNRSGSSNTKRTNTWAICAAGSAAKLAIEAVDRCMRGETAAACAYESENGLLGILADKKALYHIELPATDEPLQAILDSYPQMIGADHNAEGKSAFDSDQEQCPTTLSRDDYKHKFLALTDEMVSPEEQQRFLSIVQSLPQLASGELLKLTLSADRGNVLFAQPDGRGIF